MLNIFKRYFGIVFNKRKTIKVRNVCDITPEDIECLEILFSEVSPQEYEGNRFTCVCVNPKLIAVRRLRVIGLIEYGELKESQFIDFGYSSKYEKTENVKPVARLTGLGKIALWGHIDKSDLLPDSLRKKIK